MLRRERKDRREVVDVVPVEVVPLSAAKDDSEVTLPHRADTVDPFLPHAADAAPSPRSAGDDPAAALGEHDRRTDPRTPDIDVGDTPHRSVPWPIVAALVVILGGLVGWAVTRGSDPAAELPVIPRNPSAQYSFRIERAVSSQVSVGGGARAAYVAAATSESGTLYALDESGSTRWSVDIGPETGGSGPAWLDVGDLIVTATTHEVVDDNGTPTGIDTTVTAVDPADGTISWQVTVPDAMGVGKFSNRLLLASQRSHYLEPFLRSADASDQIELFTIDLVTGERTSRLFDAVETGLLPGTPIRSSIAVMKEGNVFLVDGDLTAISEPIAVGDQARFDATDDAIGVAAHDTLTVYDRDGNVLNTAPVDFPLPETTGGEASVEVDWKLLALEDGTWWIDGVAIDTTSWEMTPVCGSIPLADTRSSTSVPDSTDTPCFTLGLLSPFDGQPTLVPDEVEPGGDVIFEADGNSAETGEIEYSLEFETSESPPVSTAESSAADDLEFKASWSFIPDSDQPATTIAGLNGYISNTADELVGTRTSDNTTLFELPLDANTGWQLIDGGIAMWEPENSGATNAVSITVYS